MLTYAMEGKLGGMGLADGRRAAPDGSGARAGRGASEARRTVPLEGFQGGQRGDNFAKPLGCFSGQAFDLPPKTQDSGWHQLFFFFFLIFVHQPGDGDRIHKRRFAAQFQPASDTKG